MCLGWHWQQWMRSLPLKQNRFGKGEVANASIIRSVFVVIAVCGCYCGCGSCRCGGVFCSCHCFRTVVVVLVGFLLLLLDLHRCDKRQVIWRLADEPGAYYIKIDDDVSRLWARVGDLHDV